MTTKPCTIIAEAGVNHNGCLDTARRLVDAAASAGADVVKFQTFKAEGVASRSAEKAGYQKRTTSADESQLDMLRRLELDEQSHVAIIEHCRSLNISFLSTPFDLVSLELLVERFRLETIKIPSGEITNLPFLLEIARKGRKVILSTGMSTIGEVEAALATLAFGFTAPAHAMPEARSFDRAFASRSGREALREKVVLLHCTTEYPAAPATVNLRAMETLRCAFGLPIGLSDHTVGIHIPIAAVALGATVVEKHFTLDRTMPGPDHAASLEPQELAAMIRQIRDVEAALGDGVKQPCEAEQHNRLVARRSLIATEPIRIGDMFTLANLGCKRPGDGIPPAMLWTLLGRQSRADYEPDEPIRE